MAKRATRSRERTAQPAPAAFDQLKGVQLGELERRILLTEPFDLWKELPPSPSRAPRTNSQFQPFPRAECERRYLQRRKRLSARSAMNRACRRLRTLGLVSHPWSPPTPLGELVVKHFRHELEAGKRIRWAERFST